MQRFLFWIVLLATVSTAIGSAPDRGVVLYRDPFEPSDKSGQFFDLSRGAFGVRGMHVLWPFETCAPSSPYHCLRMDNMDFALSVPKRDMTPGSSWRIGKYRFVIRHVGTIPYVGRKLNATVIETIIDGAPQGHARLRAVYDPKYGLACFATLDWKEPGTQRERPYEEVSQQLCAEDIGLWPRKP